MLLPIAFRRTGAAASVVPHQGSPRSSASSCLLCSSSSSTARPLAASALFNPPRQRRAFFSSLSSASAISSSSSSTTPASSSIMDADVRAAVERLHAQKMHKVVVYATGGAAQALSWLLTVPGASNTVLEARVPYGGARSWADALGKRDGNLPASLASAPAAAALAEAAYRQAAQLSPFVSPSSSDILGVGCCCALATGRERAGSDRVFVAAHGAKGVFSASAEIEKGTFSSSGSASASPPPPSRSRREAQDALASRLLLRTLGNAVGCQELASLGLYSEGEGEGKEPEREREEREREKLLFRLEERFDEREDPISALLAGRASCVELGAGLPAVVDAPRGEGRVYLSGSFNPLHAGHEGLLEAAVAAAVEEARGAAAAAASASSSSSSPFSSPSSPSFSVLPIEGAFEISIVNADKGTLTEAEIRRRVEQFSDSNSNSSFPRRRRRVVLTRAPLFEQKASLFGPGASFVVGIDTAVRLLDPKYYPGGSDAGLGLCMGRIAARGAKVFVAGRKVEEKTKKTKSDDGGDGGGDGGGGKGEGNETFLTLTSSGALDSTPAAKVVKSLGLFREITEEKFRVDVSSTELRRKG